MAVVYACLGVGSLIPCVGGIIQLVIQGPLMGGLYWFFLKRARGQEAGVGDAFAGFSMSFLQLFLTGLVTGLLTGLCMLPAIAAIVAVSAMRVNLSPLIIGLAVFISAIPVVYLSVCWMFSMPLVIDKKLAFWPAMELSRKVLTMHWGNMFLLLLVCGLVTLAGVLALCVGVLVAAPVAMAAIVYAYEDIFSGGTNRAG